MSITPEDVKKIAHLARLNLTEKELSLFAPQLSRILELVEQMNATNTEGIAPLAHPLDLPQRLRKDEVTAHNERDKFQRIAPQVEAGLYLVPKVLEA